MRSSCSRKPSRAESTTSKPPSTTAPHVINELIRQALHPYPTELVLVTKVGARGDNRGGILAYDEPASSDEESRRTCGPATWPRFRWSTCASCGRHDRTRCSTTNSPR